MTAKSQVEAPVRIVSPRETILQCQFPRGVELHGCVQNVVRLQVDDHQIYNFRNPSRVMIDIIEELQKVHREIRLIASGEVNRHRRLLELHVHSADLLDRALAPVIVAIQGNDLRASYKNLCVVPARPQSAFAA